MDWGKVPPAEMKQRQVRKLREFLSRKVYPYCPYYRRLFDQHKLKPEKLRQLEDLSHIPFTTKADIAPTADDPARFREFIIQPTPEQLKANLTLGDKLALFLKSRSARRSIPDLMLDEYLPLMPTFTTGRTSLPTAFVYTRADIDILSVAGSRMFKSIGLVRKDDRGLNVFPFVPHLAFWQVAFAGFEYGLFLLHSGGGKAMGTPKILDIAARSKPTFLVGTPGYVMHLAHVAEEQGVEISSLRRVILGAERASPEYKAKLRNQLARIGSPDVQIFVTYGFTEAKKAWTENADDPGSRFLTYPDMEIIEVIDPDTGEAVPEGHAGEIVYTHIG
ncbi:AMP-binding protein, partial [bacterium]|nr:AMP-binding protein [bacterium]